MAITPITDSSHFGGKAWSVSIEDKLMLNEIRQECLKLKERLLTWVYFLYTGKSYVVPDEVSLLKPFVKKFEGYRIFYYEQTIVLRLDDPMFNDRKVTVFWSTPLRIKTYWVGRYLTYENGKLVKIQKFVDL